MHVSQLGEEEKNGVEVEREEKFQEEQGNAVRWVRNTEQVNKWHRS